MSRLRSRYLNVRPIWDRWSLLCLLIPAMVLVVPRVGAATGAPAQQTATRPSIVVGGLVKNSYTGVGIPGATVTFKALNMTRTAQTDANGVYRVRIIPNAFYDITFEAANYNGEMLAGSIVNTRRRAFTMALEPVARVIIDVDVTGDAQPGATMTATASYTVMDGSTVDPAGTGWVQGAGVPADLNDPMSTTTDVTLGDISTYADHLIQILKSPPITEDQLPPDVVLQPINEIEKGLQDRNQVVPINPFALEKAEDIPLTFLVKTSSGTYSKDASIVTELPWVVSAGIPTVPVNSPALLLAKCVDELDEITGIYECTDQTSFSWQITARPNGSTAQLMDADTRSPWFTPDRVGVFIVQETMGSGADLAVHVGRFVGAIDPVLTLNEWMFGDQRPVGDENCTGCHNGTTAPDNFATWRLTGHAEAFTQDINTSDHFGENCFGCHSVGFGTNASGIDSTPNYQNFLNLLADNQHNGTIDSTWEQMLMLMPDTARLTNIQCENCHGPQAYTQAHQNQPGDPRVSLASDVCGSCHGEPGRHGRFQQWQLSNHADYDLARSRGASSGNCSRCHSGNGFVAWNALGFDPDQEVDVTWNQDTVVPQTCVACHDPHDTGTTSGSDDTDAKVRLMGNTAMLLAGFQAVGVGKGATCMTCHNSRAEFVRNDSTWAATPDGDKTDRPHHGVQADLLMGQNAYFVQNGNRGKHVSGIEDVCVTCHMNKTQPPDILSYNQAGTNHTFAADPKICVECHTGGFPNTGSIQASVNALLDELVDSMGNAYLDMLTSSYPVNIGGACGPADGTTKSVTSVVWNGRATRLNITMSDGSLCENVNPSSVTVNDGAETLFELSLATNDGAVLKAAWNWTINEEDEGRGVHNPAFSIAALENAITAVNQ